MSYSIPFHTVNSSYSPTIQTITRWFFLYKKCWSIWITDTSALMTRWLTIFFEKSENIGCFDWLGLKRSAFRSDDGYSGRIIFLIFSRAFCDIKRQCSVFYTNYRKTKFYFFSILCSLIRWTYLSRIILINLLIVLCPFRTTTIFGEIYESCSFLRRIYWDFS